MEPRNCTVLGAAQCEYPNTLPVRAQTACTSNYHTTAEPYATRVNGQPAVLCSQKRRALVLGLETYPFTAGSLRAALSKMVLDHRTTMACQRLADQIDDIEGLAVHITVPFHTAHLGPPDPYPYRRAMGANKTVREWERSRFHRNYPGFLLRHLLPEYLSPATSLLDARRMSADAKRIYGNDLVDNVTCLLRTTECSSLDQLQGVLDDRVAEPYGITLRDYGSQLDIGFGFEDDEDCPLTIGELYYPFPALLVWSMVGELERENDTTVALLELAEQILEIEGIQLYFDVAELTADEFPISYPYRKPMSGRKTIEEWLEARFEPNYPALEPAYWVYPSSMQLSEVRKLTDAR
jgi:hypothetical protein